MPSKDMPEEWLALDTRLITSAGVVGLLELLCSWDLRSLWEPMHF